MLYKLTVPGPIDDVEEVRVLEWHAQDGAAVSPGDPMVELETHKAVVEVRAGQPGALRTVLCQPGEWRKLGEPLAVLSDTGDEPLDGADGALCDWSSEFEVT